MVNFPIDIVIPWVDGSDSQWLERKNIMKANLGQATGDSGDTRYRDWGLLRYVFRGIEQNAPWVRRVFLITDHQIPKWLNTDYNKVQIVFHDEYIPRQYLPTFSSHTIELNLHRIKELSEHFIYMNDDMFFVNSSRPEDFFTRNGLPKTTAVVSPWKVTIGDYFFVPFVNAAVISRNFDFHHTVAHNLGKWLNFRYGINMLRTLLSLPYPYFVGFMETHLPNAFLKSTFEEVWDKEEAILDQTCKHHFRENTDVNQYLMREWQVASGQFQPAGLRIGRAFQLRNDWEKQLKDADQFISSRKGKIVCINDTDMIDDLDAAINMTHDIFESILPNRSVFEKY